MILGFTGKLGSGKDTAGERMANLVDLPSRRVSFAAPLKESAAALLDIPVEDWEVYKNDPDVKILLTDGYVPALGIDLDIEEPNVIREYTAREFLQRYGTQSHRDIFGEDFWVEQALNTLRYTTVNELVYLTDVRFENEARALKAVGGYLIRINGQDEHTGTHISELGLPDYFVSFMVDNTVRDDNYVNLDYQLVNIARQVGLPVKEASLA